MLVFFIHKILWQQLQTQFENTELKKRSLAINENENESKGKEKQYVHNSRIDFQNGQKNEKQQTRYSRQKENMSIWDMITNQNEMHWEREREERQKSLPFWASIQWDRKWIEIKCEKQNKNVK